MLNKKLRPNPREHSLHRQQKNRCPLGHVLMVPTTSCQWLCVPVALSSPSPWTVPSMPRGTMTRVPSWAGRMGLGPHSPLMSPWGGWGSSSSRYQHRGGQEQGHEPNLATLKRGRCGDSSCGHLRAHGKGVSPSVASCSAASTCPQREGDYRTLEQGMHWGHCGGAVEVLQLSHTPTRMERGSSAHVPAGVQLLGNETGWRCNNSLIPSYSCACN